MGWVPIRYLCGGNFLLSTIGTVLTHLGTVFFSGAVDGNLDRDLATFDLLAIHLLDSLLLQLLRGESDETEASSLARFVACGELFDHETWDGAESNLSGTWLVGSKEVFEL